MKGKVLWILSRNAAQYKGRITIHEFHANLIGSGAREICNLILFTSRFYLSLSLCNFPFFFWFPTKHRRENVKIFSLMNSSSPRFPLCKVLDDEFHVAANLIFQETPRDVLSFVRRYLSKLILYKFLFCNSFPINKSISPLIRFQTWKWKVDKKILMKIWRKDIRKKWNLKKINNVKEN